MPSKKNRKAAKKASNAQNINIANGEKVKKQKGSYTKFIKKKLKEMNPNTGISSKAMRIMNRIVHLMNSDVHVIFECIAAEAAHFALINKRSRITSQDIQTAVLLLLAGSELGEIVVSKRKKSTTTYTSSKYK